MKRIIKIWFLLIIFYLFFNSLFAKSILFKIEPWNGYTAAVSLTFDDGDPIHLDFAIPEMQKRNIRGTFFLIAGRILRQNEWEKAAASGMEIGNHSMTHRHIYELSEGDEINEVDKAGEILKELSGKPVLIFASPFLEMNEERKARVEKNCFIARGGGPGNYYYTPDTIPDWYNIHSQITMADYEFDTYRDWIDQAIFIGAWTVFTIHSIEGSNWFQPIPQEIFIQILDYLVRNKNNIWIAPFGEVGAYYKAQQTIDNIKPVKKNNLYIYKWKKPEPFPDGVILKLRLLKPEFTILQEGKKIEPDEKGIYKISFDTGEFVIKK